MAILVEDTILRLYNGGRYNLKVIYWCIQLQFLSVCIKCCTICMSLKNLCTCYKFNLYTFHFELIQFVYISSLPLSGLGLSIGLYESGLVLFKLGPNKIEHVQAQAQPALKFILYVQFFSLFALTFFCRVFTITTFSLFAFDI